MKSIRQKILVFMLTIVIAALALAGGVSSFINYKSTLTTLEQTVSETAKIASKRVTAELAVYKCLIQGLSNNIAKSGTVTINQGIQISEDNNLLSFNTANVKGVTQTGENLAETEYFKSCRDTLLPYLSDPIVNKQDNSIEMIIAAPLIRRDTFYGIAFASVEATFLSDIAADIRIGSGNAAILDKNGRTIGYADIPTVLAEYNTQEEAKDDSALKKLAEIEKEMIKGECGFREYSYEGVKKFMAYAPVEGSNGWSLDVSVVQSEFLKSTYAGIFYVILISFGLVMISIFLIFRLANSISIPIRKCVSRIESLAEGDLTTPVPRITARDETKVLEGATQKLVKNLGRMIGDADYLLGEMADGNFAVSSKAEDSYVGEFLNLKNSILKINNSLTETLLLINESASQVSSGSEQLSAGAQSLSQGVVQQAGSVDELAATISEISEQVKVNANSAREASSMSGSLGKEMGFSKDKMAQMMEATAEISASSKEIGKIIKTIEDIAFQTNILALNAAVEAARAGSAGKGFAVVAEEVRNLASKSAEASKHSSAMIENSMAAVNKGTAIADDTANSLLGAVKSVYEVASIIDKIAEASNEQAEFILQVTKEIDQISYVVQTNSATAEESAAASEELSAQAQMLEELVGRFHLENQRESYGKAENISYPETIGLELDRSRNKY